ncbi:MAG: DNA-binding transcriptional regulator Fis [Chromatiaceae bacterium]|nr:DNA-binding transcriptional regulator Fis [Gammaproteobacteria bacterium]MCP5305388.1 DNA-binding transcriptional regulator Fis [Chromatiaceae bacterium]MCP5315347.1 DNA-binding transcriptional regulator Fis [Chromatiaceae bacterium]
MSLASTQTAAHTPKKFSSVSKTKKTEPLREAVRDALSRYFDQLNGADPAELYQLVIEQVERPLFRTVMDHTGGNQSRAAQILGISRSTLRKKLAQYEIE